MPPQRRDWWAEKTFREGKYGTKSVSREVHDQIVEGVDWPMGMAEAKELREELMAERSVLVGKQNDAFVSAQTFSLCEH